MGFKMSQEFPSRFLSGDEINGSIVPVTIKEVKREKVKEGTKDEDEVLVVYFEGKERGVVLKKTRANELTKITGSDDSDDWTGKKVAMYTQKKKAFGDLVNVIHFKNADGMDSDEPDELPTIQADADEQVDIDNIPF